MKKDKRPTQDFLKSGDYLPEFLKDYHDQKEIFKFLDNHIREGDKELIPNAPDWRSAKNYVIDVFLWVMARYGYTLQKSRKHVEFKDLEEALQVRHNQIMKKVMKDIRRDLND